MNSQSSAPQSDIRILVLGSSAASPAAVHELECLAQGCMEIEVAPTPQDAEKRLAAVPYDVLLIDVEAAGDAQTVLATCRKMLENRERLVVLALMDVDDQAFTAALLEAGGQDTLLKAGLDGPALLRSIRKGLARASAARERHDKSSLLRSVIDNMPDTVYVKDCSGRYVLDNAAHRHQLGVLEQEGVIGRTSYDFFSAEVAEVFAQDDAKVILEGATIINRHEASGERDGASRWLSTTKVPLRDDTGNIIGLLGIGRDITARKAAEQELKASASELREKNLAMEDDLRMAREVQQAFLPLQFPSFPRECSTEENALRFFSKYLPTTALGGDFFHVQAISDTKAGLFICDVMGHGVRAALVTAVERTLVEELQAFASEPGEFLTQMNASLLAILRRTNSPMFVSAFYLVVDLVSGSLQFANAGHPYPLHLRRGDQRLETLGGGQQKPGPALGVFAESAYSTLTTTVAVGDLVVLFTDGLFEVEGPQGELFDQSLLHGLVKQRLQHPPERLLEEMLEAIRALSVSGTFEDDVCLVGMEVERLLVAASGHSPVLALR